MNGKPWTAWQLRILRREYPRRQTVLIARKLRRSLVSVYQKAIKMGMRKSAAFMATDRSGRIQRGRTDPRMVATQFPKGHVPANAGLRRPGWGPGRMKETQFKRGERSGVAVRLYKPIGTERVSKDGYLERKVNDDLPLQARWKAVHRIVWEAAHGPIPAGHVVCFLKGKSTSQRDEITVDRLELVHRRELAKRNRMWTLYPPEVAKAMHLVGQLKRRIRQKERHAQES